MIVWIASFPRSGNVLSWLRPEAGNRLVLRYETLIGEPISAVTAAMASLVPEMLPQGGEAPILVAAGECRRDGDAWMVRRLAAIERFGSISDDASC